MFEGKSLEGQLVGKITEKFISFEEARTGLDIGVNNSQDVVRIISELGKSVGSDVNRVVSLQLRSLKVHLK